MEVVFSEYASLFPARAGVIPAPFPGLLFQSSIPRTRGGDPKRRWPLRDYWAYSPHARG